MTLLENFTHIRKHLNEPFEPLQKPDARDALDVGPRTITHAILAADSEGDVREVDLRQEHVGNFAEDVVSARRSQDAV